MRGVRGSVQLMVVVLEGVEWMDVCHPDDYCTSEWVSPGCIERVVVYPREWE